MIINVFWDIMLKFRISRYCNKEVWQTTNDYKWYHPTIIRLTSFTFYKINKVAMDLGRGFKFQQGDQRCISNLLRQCTMALSQKLQRCFCLNFVKGTDNYIFRSSEEFKTTLPLIICVRLYNSKFPSSYKCWKGRNKSQF